ncbi:MAG: MFS transporter [Candidatus Neomarinimicrobiota bacterium]
MQNIKNNSLRELHGARLFGFSMGNFGIMLMLMLTGSFSYNFYVYTIRVDSILISIGSTLSMVTMAFTGIIFGVILDNTKPKKIGKRRPYILIGLPIWLISTILVYLPPWIPPESLAMESTVFYWPTAIWYWILSIIRSIFGVLMMIVYRSIVPEISQTLKNRKKIATISTNLLIISSIISTGFPLILMYLVDDSTNVGFWTVSGKFIMNIMPTISIIFSIPATICILISFFSIDENFHLNGPDFEKKKVKDAFKNLFIPVKDKEYLKFMAAGVTTQTSQYVISFTIIPFIAFVLGRNLPAAQISSFYIYYIIIKTAVNFSWLFIWKITMRRQKNILKTFKWNMIVMVIGAFLEVIFFVELSVPLRLILFIISFGTVLGSSYSITLFSSPILNEMVDRAAEMNLIENTQGLKVNKDEAVTRLSGAYSGLMTFTASMVGALSSIIFGFIFQGENSQNPVILTLGLMSMGLFQIIALVFLQSFKVKFKES